LKQRRDFLTRSRVREIGFVLALGIGFVLALGLGFVLEFVTLAGGFVSGTGSIRVGFVLALVIGFVLALVIGFVLEVARGFVFESSPSRRWVRFAAH
jgi:hypothetical protein